MTQNSRSGKKPRRVGEVLSNPGSRLGGLLQRAAYMMQLESLISGLLDPDLAVQFQVAAARKNRLILISPTAAWATRLRMQAPQLINSLQAAGITEIEHIDIRVAPLIRHAAESRSRRPLSSAAQQALDRMVLFKSNDKK
jgi:hypothetical protein